MLLVNHVNTMSIIFVSVISSKASMEMDYESPLTYPAKDVWYSEAIYISLHNDYFTHGIIFLETALFSFHKSL